MEDENSNRSQDHATSYPPPHSPRSATPSWPPANCRARACWAPWPRAWRTRIPAEPWTRYAPPPWRPGAAAIPRHVAYADPKGVSPSSTWSGRPDNTARARPPHRGAPTGVVQGCPDRNALAHGTNAATAARARREVRRLPGDIVTAAQGLGQIHRLGNAGDEVAISLHVYGIDEQALATGANTSWPACCLVASTPA